MKNSIILIKSVGESGVSSCCSGVDGLNGKDTVKTLYDHIKENHSEFSDLDILDPRNSFLTFILIKDFFRFKVPFLTALKTLFSYSVPSVIVNGQMAFKGVPTVEEFEVFLKK